MLRLSQAVTTFQLVQSSVFVEQLRKQGRSPAYLQLKKEFNDKLENESTKYMNKIYEEVSNGKRGSSYSAIRKLGNREFEQSSSTFDVPEFVDDNLDEKQSDEALAEYFSSISQEFMPLDPDNLPSKVKIELEKGIVEKNLPILNEYEVYEKVTRAKKPHSTVPGDLKRTLVKECSVELITPVTKIYNEISESKEFPRAWVIEQQTPIPKVYPPSSMLGPGHGYGAACPSSDCLSSLRATSIYSEIPTRYICTEWIPLPAQFGR